MYVFVFDESSNFKISDVFMDIPMHYKLLFLLFRIIYCSIKMKCSEILIQNLTNISKSFYTKIEDRKLDSGLFMIKWHYNGACLFLLTMFAIFDLLRAHLQKIKKVPACKKWLQSKGSNSSNKKLKH